MNRISFHSEDIAFSIRDSDELSGWIEDAALDEKKILGNLSFIFCSDEYLLNVNREHLNHDYYTDIITFDYCENNTISGDIFISIDRVKENGKLFDSGFKNELHRVIIHGVLHVTGVVHIVHGVFHVTGVVHIVHGVLHDV